MSKAAFGQMFVASFAILISTSTTKGEEPAETAPSPISAAEQHHDARPADSISLDIWIISVRAPEKGTNNESATRLSNLHTALGHREDVASLIAELDSDKSLVKFDVFRVVTVADHAAGITLGWRKPRITSTAITQLGTTNGIVIEPLGTMLNLTPHVDSDGSLRTEIKLETSMLLQSNDVPISVPSKGDSIFALTMSNFKIDTDVRMLSGEAKLVAATPGNDASETALQLVILAASLDRPAEAGRSK
ncbi:MAG TPA: hypothetical protein VGM76_00830 [Lacipirellulaceae bacterium]|jgi:hypothetical protein